MVQGGLLTAHSGGVHGDGEAAGGESSLLQGAGTGSLGSPDVETEVASEKRRDCEKQFFPRVFRLRCKYRPKGGQGGGPRGPGAPQARPPVVPLRSHSGDSGRFFCADFFIYLSNGKT